MANSRWGKYWYEAPNERTVNGELFYFAGPADAYHLNEEQIRYVKRAVKGLYGCRVRMLRNSDGEREFWTDRKVVSVQPTSPDSVDIIPWG